MQEIIVYLSSIIFGLCSAFLMGLAELFNISYKEISVYFNLYFQYIIIILSCLSVFLVSLKHFKFTFNKCISLILIVLYNSIIIKFGIKLYQRYGIIDINHAFNLCKNDLLSISKYIILNTDNPYYKAGWTEYFITNIIIFVIIFLLILLFNLMLKKLIKKSLI
jgi:hypothetical protein